MRNALRVEGIQYGALPWRRAENGIEVLLITSRHTRRWIVPKGWPMEGCTPGESAAREALEEAGVVGEISAKALGLFRYVKLRKSGERVPCVVHVFALEVSQQQDDWIEKPEREICWCAPADATARVSDPGLRRVIAKFAKMHGAAAAA